jgi:hypothetical protein
MRRATATSVLACALCASLALAGCGVARAKSSAELRAPAALADLLAPLSAEGRALEVRFEARAADGAPLPHALVQLDWEEGGRTAFQADESGVLRVRFPRPAELGAARVWVRTVAEGQSFVGHEYESYSRELEGGSLRVHVRPAPEAE